MCRLCRFAVCLMVLSALTADGFALDKNSNANDVKLWFNPWETPANTKINQDLTTQLQNEEQVAVNPKDPDNLVAVWRDFRLERLGFSWDNLNISGTQVRVRSLAIRIWGEHWDERVQYGKYSSHGL